MNIKKIFHFSVGPIGAALLGILTVPILAWSFSPDDMGRFSVLQIIMSFSSILFTLGLDQSYVRDYHESSDRAALLKTVLLPPIVFFVLFVLIFFNNIEFLADKFYQIKSSTLAWATVGCVLLTVLLRYLSLTIRMQERGLLYSVSQITPKLLLLLFIFIIYMFDCKDNTFYILIVIQLISLLVIFLFFLFFIKKEFILALKSKFDFNLLKRLLVFGFPLVISGLVFWLMQSLSRIVLLDLSTLTELGIFGVATSVAAGFSILTSIFNTIWVPIIYKLVKENKGVKQVEKISKYIALIIAVIIFFVGLMMPIIPKFLPVSYSGIEYIILLCIMQPLLYTLSEATAVGILIERKTNYSVLISFLSMIINFLLLIKLVPHYGALGSAISVVISFGFYLILRTEFSAFLWMGFDRVRMYLSVFLSIVFVVVSAFFSLKYLYVVLGSLVLVIFNFFIFFSELKKNFNIKYI
ncbi:oligosaccharide flippase family protein [Acinetobacter sp. ANC 7200]|uniref:lipopolysaccharide biosynthesis protein n=1 Tax=Acinetobacter amyesii TaxID=2942470 RepID=UPI0020BEC8F3|nr:oligosaccharide flippase family protein [Acinetobacter amyesii]MCL6244586.1 oligosaccharide flippase family protein [Acinetobacter amyesii]